MVTCLQFNGEVSRQMNYISENRNKQKNVHLIAFVDAYLIANFKCLFSNYKKKSHAISIECQR